MTGKERMKIALTGGIPDRVPCAPDISNMVPCRLAVKNFCDVYVRNNPPLWRAYINAVNYYGIDAWFTYGQIDYKTKSQVERKTYIEKEGEREIIVTITDTPKGSITEKVTCYPKDSPTLSQKAIKDFKEDFPKFKYLFSEITGYSLDIYKQQVQALGDSGLFAVGLFPPSFATFLNYFDGNLEALTYAYYDYRELFDELIELYTARMNRELEIILEVKPESVLTGASGLITLQSPSIFREITLKPLQLIASECAKHGIITGVHSCGLESYLVKECAERTDINYINPLEIRPQGDCELKSLKTLYGDKIALMGNLHTTNTMLRGSAAYVKAESLKAILDTAEGGGFVLSTGDQCGRDTPDENILMMVDVCKQFGQYPIDRERIKIELNNLEANAVGNKF